MKTVRTIVVKDSRVATPDAAGVYRASPGGGWGTRPLARNRQLQDVEDTVEVTVDVDAIAILIARRASEHPKGRATAFSGKVRARRMNRKITSSRTIPDPPATGGNDVRQDLGYGR